MYDVIVIGAGPAGCTAAKTLAERGYRVLLTEKFKLPRYKSCSGVLIKKSVALIEQLFGQSVPRQCMCLPVDNRGMVLTDASGREYRFEQPGINVWRSSFDSFLASKAVECGAELRDGTAAVSCINGDGYVTVGLRGSAAYTETARYVIDCEGAVGSLKHKLGYERYEYITTYQTFNEGSIDLDSHYFYAYLQPELSEYDAWFNVKDNLLVLGVAVRNPDKIKMYYDNFISYMSAHHGLKTDRCLGEDRWIMPRIRQGCGIDHGTGRILFAGEAASFLNPMGEGISAGIESGYIASCAVADNFDDLNGIYEQYRQAAKPLADYMKRQWNFVASVSDTFSDLKTPDIC